MSWADASIFKVPKILGRRHVPLKNGDQMRLWSMHGSPTLEDISDNEPHQVYPRQNIPLN
jgi:hypothetical protein